MPEYYPVFLSVRGRACVVIGGGDVAERKAEGLLRAGASVTVVSPQVTPALAKLAHEGRLAHLKRAYRSGDLAGTFLAIAATDAPEVQRAVAREAEQLGVLLNVVDAPALCTFIAPSVVRRGDVVVAISTGGGSPALARWLREELEGLLPEELADIAEIVASVRQELRERNVQVSPEEWSRSLRDAVLARLFKDKRKKAEAVARLLDLLMGGAAVAIRPGERS